MNCSKTWLSKLRLGLRLAKLAGVCVLAMAPQAAAMGEVDSLTFGAGADSALSAVIDSTRTYAYVGTGGTPTIVKIRLSDMTSQGTLAASTGPLTSVVIDTSTYAYFGSSTTPGAIMKIQLSDFTEISSMTLSAGLDSLAPAVIDLSGAFAYFGTQTSPGSIVKIGLSSFTHTASLTLQAGEDRLTCGVIDTAQGFAYFGTHTSPGQVVKIRLSDFTRVETRTLQAGENSLTSAVISTVTGYAYFGTNTSPGRIVRIRLSDFTRAGSLTLNAGEDSLTSAVIDSSSTYAYFGTNTSPGQVVRVRLSDFTEVFTVTLTGGEDSLLSAVIDSPANYAYFGAGLSPAQVIKVDLLDTRTGPPVITGHPSSQSVNPGGAVTFFVSASGSTPFTYQWMKYGAAIGGAASASYTIPPATFADNAALYHCVVTNALGSTASNPASLTVIPVIRVFPNPWRSDVHSASPISFEGAAPNTTLKIFTLSLHWLKTLNGGGTLTWDLSNDAGQRASSGYYLYLATTPDENQAVRGKFAIIK